MPHRGRIGRKETEVGINTRRHRMVIAGAEMAVSPELLAIPPDNHRHLCMCFPVNEAIDELPARTFQRTGPSPTLLLSKTGLQLNDSGYGLARTGRVDERTEHKTDRE